MAIWITGLPGSGKSTVAEGIKKGHPDFVLLRMDEMRKVVTPEPSYSDPERDMVYRAFVCLAKTLTDLGHDVIMDATANRRVWRNLARELIPAFAEVYLKCSIEICTKREKHRENTHAAPRDIYKKGAEGQPVPGISVPYEEPLNPEIVVDTGTASLAETVEVIEKEVSLMMLRRK